MRLRKRRYAPELELAERRLGSFIAMLMSMPTRTNAAILMRAQLLHNANQELMAVKFLQNLGVVYIGSLPRKD
jgi:hypothetical protein